MPPILPEIITTTGPHKLTGGSRQHWIDLIDLIKDRFAKMVMHERGDRIRITEAQLLEGKLYAGQDAVSLGLADAIGVTGDGVEKAAELAGIGRYGIVDVNAKVFRETRMARTAHARAAGCNPRGWRGHRVQIGPRRRNARRSVWATTDGIIGSGTGEPTFGFAYRGRDSRTSTTCMRVMATKLAGVLILLAVFVGVAFAAAYLIFYRGAYAGPPSAQMAYVPPGVASANDGTQWTPSVGERSGGLVLLDTLHSNVSPREKS